MGWVKGKYIKLNYDVIEHKPNAWTRSPLTQRIMGWQSQTSSYIKFIKLPFFKLVNFFGYTLWSMQDEVNIHVIYI